MKNARNKGISDTNASKLVNESIIDAINTLKGNKSNNQINFIGSAAGWAMWGKKRV